MTDDFKQELHSLSTKVDRITTSMDEISKGLAKIANEQVATSQALIGINEHLRRLNGSVAENRQEIRENAARYTALDKSVVKVMSDITWMDRLSTVLKEQEDEQEKIERQKEREENITWTQIRQLTLEPAVKDIVRHLIALLILGILAKLAGFIP